MEDDKYLKALESLLFSLGWATNPEREGRATPAELLILRDKIHNAYKVLGFTEEDLKGQEFGNVCVAGRPRNS